MRAMEVLELVPDCDRNPIRSSRTHHVLDDIRHYIQRHHATRLTLEDLAARADLSIFRFLTLFRRLHGVTPYRFLSMVRVEAAKQLLLQGVPPAIVAIEVGFCDQSHLCRHFRSICGRTPGQFLAEAMSASSPAYTTTGFRPVAGAQP